MTKTDSQHGKGLPHGPYKLNAEADKASESHQCYHDSFGNECSIEQMIDREPGWVASRFRVLEEQIKAKDEAMRELARITGCLEPNEQGMGVCGGECIACKALKGDPCEKDRKDVVLPASLVQQLLWVAEKTRTWVVLDDCEETTLELVRQHLEGAGK
jgi:hypothetical protein